MYRSVFIIALSMLMIGETTAAIIRVPTNDYPTIQAGINAAFPGDTVLVADGTYYENIDYKGKAITVASYFLIDGDTTHVDSTIIDGSQPITFQIKLPQAEECLLLKDGEVIQSSRKRVSIIHRVKEPGVYRIEAYIEYKGKRRGWIFSNPIYVR